MWSGRLSLSSHGWLADHAVGGQVLLPGTAFLDVALHVALRSGLSGVAELTLQQPLVLPPRGEVELQVVVDRGVADGPRVAVYSRLVGDEGAGWSAHAVGVLGVVGGVGGGDVSVPEGAEVLPVDGLYERLSEGGFGYGPAFRGLRRAWRGVSEGEVTAEVALPRGWRDRAGDHVVHPALLDAVLHVLSFVDLPGLRSGLLPFSWSGVRVFASGAASVLARVVWVGGGAVSVELVDGSGGVVLSVDELVLRPAGGLVSGGGPLYGLSWTPTEPTTTETSDGPDGATVRLDPGAGADALGALSDPIPSTVVVPLRTWEGDLTEAPAAARAATASALELLRTWIADERYADSRLVFAVTVPTIEAVDDDIVTAAVR
ncbi:polyketide synthase dehydratase domain-containing protein, partial [Brevundimonas sp. NPDC055320]